MQAAVPPAITILAVLLASFIRGYSGIGFAVMAVAIISIFHPPDVAIPAVIMLEILISLILIPPVRRDVDVRPVGLITIGAVLLTPIGALLLMRVDENWARILVAVAVATVAIALLATRTVRPDPGRLVTVVAGGIAGLLNGAVGVSGPPIILFFLGTERGASVSRASMMASFLVIDVFTVLWFGIGGLITQTALITVLYCLPSLVIGSQLGARVFHQSDQSKFRRRVLLILLAVSVVIFIRGAAALMH